MHRLARRAWLLLTAVLLSCASFQVDVDYDQAKDFSGYRTFTWFPRAQPQTGDYRIDDPLLEQRIREAVEQQLQARGFRKVEDVAPDFYVTYHLSIEQKLDVYTVNRGYYGPYGYYVGWPETEVRQYDEGTLVIDIADQREKKVVWRGLAVGRVRQHATPEERTQAVNEAVAAILAKFPPQPKG
jgi:hypothetical protein